MTWERFKGLHLCLRCVPAFQTADPECIIVLQFKKMIHSV